jgi:hypothetical protein
MKYKIVWSVWMLAMTAASSSFAAGYIVPRVVPSSYNHESGFFYEEPADTTQSVDSHLWKLYQFGDGGGIGNGAYYPNYGGAGPYEAWYYSWWNSPEWPITGSPDCSWERWVSGVYSNGVGCVGTPVLTSIMSIPTPNSFTHRFTV